MEHSDREKKVSVIVLTYNSDFEKLKLTLNSIALQEKIEYEFIIADDGSENVNKNIIEQYAREIFIEKKLEFVWNQYNQGTIKNYLSAIKKAEGKYVYGISPGDCFYDEYVLHDLFQFAEVNDVDVCFGKPQCYVSENGKIRPVKRVSPSNPEIFAKENYRKSFAEMAFFFGQYPIGATYFRKRNFLEHCLTQIAGHVTYLEDEASTSLYLLEGGKLLYYNRFVVFYEANSGISTNKNHCFALKFEEDIKAVGTYIAHHYKENPLVKFKWVEPRFLRMFYHPQITACAILIKALKFTFKFKKEEIGNVENLAKIQNYGIEIGEKQVCK